MKFYSVVSAFYDNGKTTAFLGDVIEADTIPEESYTELRNRDVYVDWFETRDEALAFANSAINA